MHQVDATLLVDLPGRPNPVLAPLELKTGRSHVSHHAQVLLYLLLLASRYDRAVLDGVLWYTGQQQPQLLKHKAVEVRTWTEMSRSTTQQLLQIAALMQQRNRLAAAMVHGRALPRVLRDEYRCRRCFQRQHCALLHRVGLPCTGHCT